MDAAERDLVLAAQQGERAAFDRLVDLHGPALLRYLQVLANFAPEAEDMAQETLLQAFRGLHTFQKGTDFRAWLFTIAYHTWVHERRRRKPVAAVEQDFLERVPAPKAAAGEDALSEALRRAVAALPEDQRAVVQLRFGEDFSHQQIAEITAENTATVRSKLFRARQTLRRILEAWAPVSREKKNEM